MSILHTILLANVVLAAGGPQAADSEIAAARAYPAVTKPVQDLELAFPMPGRIERLDVAQGDAVAKGQVLAELENDDIDAQIALAELRAANAASVEAAQAGLESAKDMLARVERAFADHGANEKELLDARTRVVTAQADLVEAQQRIEEAKLEARQHRARLDRSRLTAPFAGVVECVKVERGGSIDELAAVVRVVDTSRLRIDVPLPIDVAESIVLKATLGVRARDSAAGTTPMPATVVWRAEVADPASRTRVVRLEMENADGRPAGVPVEVLVPATVAGAGAGERAR